MRCHFLGHSVNWAINAVCKAGKCTLLPPGELLAMGRCDFYSFFDIFVVNKDMKMNLQYFNERKNIPLGAP